MPLHPEAAAVVADLERDGVMIPSDMTPAVMRELVASRPEPTPEPVAAIDEFTVPGPGGDVPVRRYQPLGKSSDVPTVVFFHGGGWVFGNLDTHDARCRRLANRGRCIVVAVDYRLAPEHPFPAAFEDAWAVTRWAGDRAAAAGATFGVTGDSAGGNLAAAVAIAARDEGLPLALQVLVYPAVDARPERYPSYIENAAGPLLTTAMTGWFLDRYAGSADRGDWRLAPIRHDDLSGVAQSVIITAELDPLRDEGEAYGARLEAAGVPTTVTRYEGMFHAFLGFPERIEAAEQAHDEVAQAVRSVLET
ncbi:MAG: alpha/beta hydrolase [Acidimicrobiia bacterium]